MAVPLSWKDDLVEALRVDARIAQTSCSIHTIEEYDDATSTTGRRVEMWQREERLGQGGFGEVFLERCTFGKREKELRAVKVIRRLPGGTSTDEDNTFGVRELQAVALFSQTKYQGYFVTATGWFEHESSLFIAMEYLENGDLSRYTGSALPEVECQRIIRQVLQGIAYMHSHGLTHRDLKPQIKIADFGISKRVLDEYTSLRTQVGTNGFQAPEVFTLTYDDSSDEDDNPSYTNAVDMWALGVICLLLSTGVNKFSDRKTLSRYAKGKLSFPDDFVAPSQISAGGIDFISNHLRLQPQERLSASQAQQHTWLKQERSEAPLCPEQSSPLPDWSGSATWSSEKNDSGNTPFLVPRRTLAAVASQAVNQPALSRESTEDKYHGSDVPESNAEAITASQARQSQPPRTATAGEVSVRSASPNQSTTDTSDLREWREMQCADYPRDHQNTVFSFDLERMAFTSDLWNGALSAKWAVAIWDISTKPIRKVQSWLWPGERTGNNATGPRLQFSWDGQFLAGVDVQGTTFVRSDLSGLPYWSRTTLPPSTPAWPFYTALAFSPDNQRLAVARGGIIAIVNAMNGHPVYRWTADMTAVMQIAFSPNGQQLAAQYAYQFVQRDVRHIILDSTTGRELHRLTQDGWSRHMSFSPDGEWLALAGQLYLQGQRHSFRAAVWLYNAETAQEVRRFDLLYPSNIRQLKLPGRLVKNSDFNGGAHHIAFSPDGKWLAVALAFSKPGIQWPVHHAFVAIIDQKLGIERQRLELRAQTRLVNNLSFSSDSQRLACTCRGTVENSSGLRIWTNVSSGHWDNTG